MRKDHYEIDGRRWLSISRAAKLLGTNAQGIRKLMGEGALEWRQTRANSRTFVVDERAVLELRMTRPRAIKRSPDPLATRRKEPLGKSSGGGGGIFFEHHLRLTLPPDEGQVSKRKT